MKAFTTITVICPSCRIPMRMTPEFICCAHDGCVNYEARFEPLTVELVPIVNLPAPGTEKRLRPRLQKVLAAFVSGLRDPHEIAKACDTSYANVCTAFSEVKTLTGISYRQQPALLVEVVRSRGWLEEPAKKTSDLNKASAPMVVLTASVPAPAKPAPPPPVIAKSVTRPVPPPPKPNPPAVMDSNAALTAGSVGAVAIGKTLQEPFTATDLAARLDAGQGRNPQTRAFDWLAIWKSCGWIRTAGFLQYRRSEKFGT